MLHTSVSNWLQLSRTRTDGANIFIVQVAGNTDPFLVTVILSCVQILSMITTATLTDKLGRRPLTVYPYGVTVISVLCLGIVGCTDYSKKETSSLLVSENNIGIFFGNIWLMVLLVYSDILRLSGHLFNHWRFGNWLCVRC